MANEGDLTGDKNTSSEKESSEKTGRYWNSRDDFDQFLKRLSSIDDLSWDDLHPEATDVSASKSGQAKKEVSAPPIQPQIPSTVQAADDNTMPEHNPSSDFSRPYDLLSTSSKDDLPVLSAAPSHQTSTSSWNINALDDDSNNSFKTKRSVAGSFLWAACFLLLGVGVGGMILSWPNQLEKSVGIAKSGTSLLQNIWKNSILSPIAHFLDQNDNIAQPPSANSTLKKSITLPAKPPAAPPRQVKARPLTSPSTSPSPKARPKSNLVSGSYALQVAVCASKSCVNRYQEALSPGVASSNIHRVKGKFRGKTVTRVQVGPLSRQEALQLRRKLSRIDPSFGKSFLVLVQ